jgi:hypothetical protein
MKFYIQVIDNIPTGYGLLESDLKQDFPDYNFSSGQPPSGYAEYIPSQLDREMGTFEFLEIESYIMNPDGKVTDTVKIRPMKEFEKEAKIRMLKTAFVARTGYKSWKFNELLEIFEAPFQPENPVNGGKYRWDEANQKWDRIG